MLALQPENAFVQAPEPGYNAARMKLVSQPLRLLVLLISLLIAGCVGTAILGETPSADDDDITEPIVRREARYLQRLSDELEVISLINEPTAAACYYASLSNVKKITGKILVFDLGGGTFDVTVCDIQGQNIEIRGWISRYE